MTRKTTFCVGWSWFKFNIFGLALGTNFYASVANGLRLKFKKVCGLVPAFVEVTGEKPVGRTFLPPIPKVSIPAVINPYSWHLKIPWISFGNTHAHNRCRIISKLERSCMIIFSCTNHLKLYQIKIKKLHTNIVLVWKRSTESFHSYCSIVFHFQALKLKLIKLKKLSGFVIHAETLM